MCQKHVKWKDLKENIHVSKNRSWLKQNDLLNSDHICDYLRQLFSF